jgi:hypothetical protein
MSLQSGVSALIHEFNFFQEKIAKCAKKGANIGSNVASAHITCPWLKNCTAIMVSTEGFKTSKPRFLKKGLVNDNC